MRALRFFSVVRLHSTYMLAGLLALGASGAVQLWIDPLSGTEVTIPLMLLHMFAVSSGYSVPARRGHFDYLLTDGHRRILVALVHWLVSAGPGVTVWLLLAAWEHAVRGDGTAVLASGSVAAVVLISSLGWAVTVPLPRLSGGVLWTVALFVALSLSGSWRSTLLAVADGDGWTVGVRYIVSPLLVIGIHVGGEGWLALAPGMVLGLGSAAVALWWIARSDVALEAAQ
jgi:hypothetical protein